MAWGSPRRALVLEEAWLCVIIYLVCYNIYCVSCLGSKWERLAEARWLISDASACLAASITGVLEAAPQSPAVCVMRADVLAGPWRRTSEGRG